MIFVASLGTTQIALHVVSRQFERQMSNIGQVYLDGVLAAFLPFLRDGNMTAASNALEQSLNVSVGVQDRRLMVLDAQGNILARADRAGLPQTDWPDEALMTPRGVRFADTEESIWVWRDLEGGGRVLANLDTTEFNRGRRQLRLLLLLLDLLVSAICALLGFLVARQMQRPMALVTRYLQQGLSVPEIQISASDPESARLMRAFNRMVDDAREREIMINWLADQERDAVLGRMAATLAHEVRNPLGGMAAAIQTLRKFGDQAEARQDALDFIDRGIATLREVVNATLQTYRGGSPRHHLRHQDLRDVQRLAAADAKQRGVVVHLDVAPDLPEDIPVATTEVRQVLLNLLLNAVRATAVGGKVELRARSSPDTLVLEVADQGAGLTPALAASLQCGELPTGQRGLGVAVIVRLVQQLRGRISVDAHSREGTCITLHLPFESAP